MMQRLHLSGAVLLLAGPSAIPNTSFKRKSSNCLRQPVAGMGVETDTPSPAPTVCFHFPSLSNSNRDRKPSENRSWALTYTALNVSSFKSLKRWAISLLCAGEGNKDHGRVGCAGGRALAHAHLLEEPTQVVCGILTQFLPLQAHT